MSEVSLRLLRIGAALTATLVAAGCGGGGSSPTGPSTPPVAGVPSPTPTPGAPTPAPTPMPTPSPDAVLRTATIRGANGHSASGTARVVRENGEYVLELGADFRIDSGNTDVYLARRDDGVDGGDLNLGDMQALTGRQRYPMPNDGAGYGHVVLWCRPFRIPIGRGELR